MSDTLVDVICNTCGKSFKKPLGEYNRRIKNGSKVFYCCAKCSGIGVNKNKKAKIVDVVCPVCGKVFKSSTKVRAAKFCSRSCASKGSVTEKRREAGRMACELSRRGGKEHCYKSIAILLKKREALKYSLLKTYLESKNIDFEFEYLLNTYVYDLAILKNKILIEFDGADHKYLDETKKNLCAQKYGFRLFRVKVKAGEVIPVESIYSILREQKI